MPSAIEWTDETWNPLTGCTRVSPGCDHCYMFTLYPRLRAMGVPGYETAPDDIRLLPDRLKTPLRWKHPRRVFVNSMSDLFHPKVPFAFISQVFSVMREAGLSKGHVFQVLTKRPGRAVGWWLQNSVEFPEGWPCNVWIGTSVESQKYAPRLTVLGRIPAPVRFVSAEPLLERIDLSSWLNDGAVQWVIAGGESGPGARPMDLSWVRDLRDQSTAAGVPFFLKQLGGTRKKRGGPAAVIDEEQWLQTPTMEGKTMANMSFGGQWTLEKLDILERYLNAYTTALKDQPFDLIYVDAFAGQGSFRPGSGYAEEDYGDFQPLYDGSARRALRITDKPFDRFIFNDIDSRRSLELVRLRQEYPNRSITVKDEDANRMLREFCQNLRPMERAVVFLDPFATEVSWSTIEIIAKTEKIDCWILFPVGAIARMMPLVGRPTNVLAIQLDRIFGSREHWRDFYRQSVQLSFLDTDPGYERPGGSGPIADLYRERLESVFYTVAPTRRIFKNSRNSPMFELFFGASNPVGAAPAIRIADHILRNW